MKVQEFLAHHGIGKNPFSEEDAQTDPVFKSHCIENTYHPAWDKIFGDPSEPATSIVFGEKGAGKTAMRLQINSHVEAYNRKHGNSKLFVINYDDFNSYLDRFVNNLPARRRRVDKALAAFRLWDHMDAILSIGVTDLVDRALGVAKHADADVASRLAELDRHQKRDFLLLAAFYDQSTAEQMETRWQRLRRKLRFISPKAYVPFVAGCVVTVLAVVAFFSLMIGSMGEEASPTIVDLYNGIPAWAYFAVVGGSWLAYVWKFGSRLLTAYGVVSSNRVGNATTSGIRKVLMRLTSADLSGQPIPNKDRTDDRYELVSKFQGILESLGYSGVVVLVDRVDEPHRINGSPDLMKALIWPLLDNKFLKHQGIGVKLMLPAELKYFVEREDRDFAQRARLDKQNVVPSLAWTGEALFDMANARLKACAANGSPASIRDMFEENISREHLIDSFKSLRVPRHLHKFLYHLLVAHCNSHTDEAPDWKVSKELFESELAMYRRDLESMAH
ncbi:MAG: hypothetical protein KDB27_22440 [Planctomycetales bacterium]|nr:hypothetical protein [Planctomycetales bacterium]